MLINSDDHCRIILTDDAAKRSSLNALLNVNIDKSDAERLMAEARFEVRKFRSEKPMMQDCAVVKDSEGKLWNIPHKVLERVVKV